MNSPVPGEFPAQRPALRSFDVFLDLRLNKRLSKQSWGWLFETLLRPLWRQCNENDRHLQNKPPEYPLVINIKSFVRYVQITVDNHIR